MIRVVCKLVVRDTVICGSEIVGSGRSFGNMFEDVDEDEGGGADGRWVG